MVMDGRAVFEYVVKEVVTIIDEFESIKSLNPEGIPFSKIAAIVPHQANRRMFECINKQRPGFLEKCSITIENRGNNSTASQGPSLIDAFGKTKQGDYILMIGFGAGLTLGANLYKMPDADSE